MSDVIALLPLILFFAAVYFAGRLWRRVRRKSADLSFLPERFCVVDIETTGLDYQRHEIIEIAAIRVNRDSHVHQTFHVLTRPRRKPSARIVEITGITHAMLLAEGRPIAEAMVEFMDFIGADPLVFYNADFDLPFLERYARDHGLRFKDNEVSCALKMARRAWPRRRSYRLSQLARDGGMDAKGAHRALADCRMTMTVYAAASSRLRSRR